MAFELVLIALFGLVIGSFLSVVAHRVPIGESIVAPRSRCPDCRTQLRARDNLPVVSYLMLGGRCRHCGTAIPASYPLLEIGLALTFVGAALRFQGEPEQIALACALAATLLAVTLTDLEHRIIPNRILIVAAVVAVAIVAIGDPGGLVEHGAAGAAAFGFLFLVALAYPRGMGMGDVKLAGVMGLYLGRSVAPALLIGFAIGAIYGIALIARHGAEARKRAVPFGPFLALGGLVAIFAGEAIVDAYLDSFFSA